MIVIGIIIAMIGAFVFAQGSPHQKWRMLGGIGIAGTGIAIIVQHF